MGYYEESFSNCTVLHAQTKYFIKTPYQQKITFGAQKDNSDSGAPIQR